jgi:hypothetical protein
MAKIPTLGVSSKTGSRRVRSSLAEAAELVGNSSAEAPLVPWFEDPQKLLAAVVQHALASPNVARSFMLAAATFAAHSPDRHLRTILRKTAKSDQPIRPGRAQRDRWFCLFLACRHHQLTSEGMKIGMAYEQVGKETNPILSPHRVRQLIARVKASSSDDWILNKSKHDDKDSS